MGYSMDGASPSGTENRRPSNASSVHAVVSALTAALDARDGYTSEHSSATVALTQTVGAHLGLGSDALDELAQIAALHDVGKLGVPTDIIRKAGPLNDDEWAIMREHSAIGERILKGVPDLAGVARAVRHGHERWDGGGYPDHLAGEEIPLTSRIVFICDAYDAMTSDRPYRPAMGGEEAMDELRAGAGTQFDPQVVQSLLVVLGEDEEPVNWPPRETRERAQAQALEAIAAEIGATDLFVLRRATTRQYAHLAGVGRGDGWAGNIELDCADEAHLRAAVAAGRAICVPLQDGGGRVVGPYYAGSAVIVPCPDHTVVVFGAPDGALTAQCTEHAATLAARAAALVRDVSPAKRLADELEVLEAVRSITTVSAEDVSATLAAVADRSAQALSCEFGAAMTFATDEHQGVIGCASHGWEPDDEDVLMQAMLSLVAHPERFPILYQDAAASCDLPAGFRRSDGVSALHARLVGEPPVGALLVVHAEPRLRGFTALCQRVARGISEGADVVVRRALAQERLAAENERLSERLHTDAMTGVASRAAWEEILAIEELHRGRSGAISSLVIVDVDRLKFVNDSDGHAAGDALLRMCARLLADNTRATDVVARIGGDEFAALLRYSDEPSAEAWCERLAKRLDALNVRTPGGEPLTISVGCAQTSKEITIADAVALADRRMYAQKQARRRSRTA
jgi:diguanylate cyclase (GGDEF)-like protein